MRKDEEAGYIFPEIAKQVIDNLRNWKEDKKKMLCQKQIAIPRLTEKEEKMKEHFATIENNMQLRIRSRPLWMPRFVYHWLVRRVLVMEYWK